EAGDRTDRRRRFGKILQLPELRGGVRLEQLEQFLQRNVSDASRAELEVYFLAIHRPGQRRGIAFDRDRLLAFSHAFYVALQLLRQRLCRTQLALDDELGVRLGVELLSLPFQCLLLRDELFRQRVLALLLLLRFERQGADLSRQLQG